MTYVAFREYFANVFHKYLQDKKIKRPVIVFLGGHVSHLSYYLSVFCKEHQIILCCLPPNVTHLLRPLDVSVFAPLKKHWQKFVKTLRINHDGIDIQKFDVPTALSEIIQKENSVETIKAGFKCCGLYPFDLDAVNYDRCVKQTTSATYNLKESIEQNTVKSPTNEQLLEHLEKNINNDILQQFKKLKKNKLHWNREVEYSALFNTWSKIYDDVYDGNITPDETSEINDTVEIYFQAFEDILNGESDSDQVKDQDFAESEQFSDDIKVKLDNPVIIEILNAEPDSSITIEN